VTLFLLLDVVILFVVPLRALLRNRPNPSAFPPSRHETQRIEHEEGYTTTRVLAPSATPGPRVTAFGRRPNGWAVMVVAVGVATVAYEPPPSALPDLLTAERLFKAPAEQAEEPGDVPAEGDSAPDTEERREAAETVALPIVLVLGSVRVEGWRSVPDSGREKVVTELACYLAFHRKRPVPGDVIRAAVWADGLGPEATPRTLRDYLSHTRAALGADVLPPAERGRGYQATDLLESDWGRFARLLQTAEESGEAVAVEALEEALLLVRGRPFEDVDYAWAHQERLVTQMEVAVVSAARRLGRARLASGRPDLAAEAALRGLLASPYDLSLWSLLLAAAGRQGGDALERARRDAAAVLDEAVSFVPPYSEN